MKAAWSGAPACVAALIEAGADVNAVEREGMTALMIWVSERFEGGFTTDTARDLGLEIESLAHDDERTWMFQVVYEGAEMPLHIGVFRDDISEADRSFHAPPRLVAIIEELFDREAD